MYSCTLAAISESGIHAPNHLAFGAIAIRPSTSLSAPVAAL